MRSAPLPDGHPRIPHVGYAIGRNVGTAVVRNRIRRRLRAILATEIELEPGLYLFGVHDASAADVAHPRLVDDLARLVARSTTE